MRIKDLNRDLMSVTFEARQPGGLFEGVSDGGYRRFGGYSILGVSKEDIESLPAEVENIDEHTVSGLIVKYFKPCFDPFKDTPLDPIERSLALAVSPWVELINEGVLLNVGEDPSAGLSNGKPVSYLKEFPAALSIM